jgi:type I restriction enzyme S subunit
MEAEEYTLKDLLSRIVDNRGKTCPTAEAGTALIATNCIKDDQLYPVFENVRWVDQDTMETWFRGHPEPGDILFVLKGSPGRCCLVPDPINFCIAQDMLALRADESKVSQKFLFALLRSSIVRCAIDNLHVGTMIPHFKKGDFDQLKFQIPKSREIQEWIGDQYFILSDKIELNRKMNATLEAMAQALFKSWFVDFDPVIDNALAAGNPIPDELALRAEIRKKVQQEQPELFNRHADLFPSTFIETDELGPIPEGWDATSVSESISINPSTKLKKGEIAPFADMKALPTSGYAIDGVIEKAYSGGAKFRNGDVLLARITPCLENGKTGIVNFLTDSDPVGFGSTEFIVLRGEGDLSTAFIACLARDSNFRKHCMQSMIGSSGRQRVHNSCFESYYLALPAERGVVAKFNGLAVPAFAKAERQSKENKTLAKLRDTLLPKLIAGELRISEAQQSTKKALA